MSSISAPTYDPISTATALAQKSTSTVQALITKQTNDATANAKALTSLRSAISAFQNSLSTMTGYGKSMLAQSAKLSDSTVGTAVAKPTAAAGSYSLFVKQLATASQTTYDNVPAANAADGQLTVSFGSSSFQVDLSATDDTDSSADLSPRELAAAINRAPQNQGRITAGVVSDVTGFHLVLSATATGANTISLSDTSTGATSSTAPRYVPDPAPTKVVTGQDAKLVIGDPVTGITVTQPSNVFTNIDGVTFTATRAQAPSEQPFNLTVAGDSSTTTSNVQAFVDAYNKLKSAVDGLADPGGASTAAGPFAHDAGVKALLSRLTSTLRAPGSPSLASYGIIAARDGTLTLDSTRLTRQLAADPTGLDKLIGTSNGSTPTGIAGSLDTYLDQWTDTVNGQIKQRDTAITKQQAALSKRQDALQIQYDSAYQRYLKQFTDLQTMQAAMNNNVSMFDAMFSNDKS